MHTKVDSILSSAEALRYPWESHPGHDQVVEVVPGVLWVRLKLPFRLNHVNIYLLADGDGYAMIDSGFGNEETIEACTTPSDVRLSAAPPTVSSRPRSSPHCRSRSRSSHTRRRRR